MTEPGKPASAPGSGDAMTAPVGRASAPGPAPAQAARRLAGLLGPVAAVAVAFLLGGVIVLLVGDDPITVYGLLIGSALSWPDGIGYTLFYATPLLCTGLAVALAFRCGLFNIGADGQLYAAAFATACVGIAGAALPAWLLVPLCCVTAIAGGAAWGAIPGLLKARFGAHEVITTIMLNFVAVALAGYFTQYHLKAPGDAILESVPIGAAAHVARLGRFLPGLPARIPVNVGFPLALAAAAATAVLLWRTRWGYELRATGLAPEAAEYGGIRTGRQIVLAMALSGGLAGLVAVHEVLGYRYRYYDGFSSGYGFTGIAVALLGRNHPAGVVVAALLFGALLRGSLFVDIFSNHVSKDLVTVLQAIIILCLAAEAIFRSRLLGRGARRA